MARALASPGDQTYRSGPADRSSGIAEKASMEPLADQSGDEPALWTLSRIDKTARPGMALAGGVGWPLTTVGSPTLLPLSGLLCTATLPDVACGCWFGLPSLPPSSLVPSGGIMTT